MNKTITWIAIAAMVVASTSAVAANWTTTAGGSTACTALRVEGTCYLTDISEDSAAINVSSCATLTVAVTGTGASIMPRRCDSKDADGNCVAPENLLATALTGDSPNAHMTASAPFNFIDIDWTTDGAGDTNDVSIKCGR